MAIMGQFSRTQSGKEARALLAAPEEEVEGVEEAEPDVEAADAAVLEKPDVSQGTRPPLDAGSE
jgi:hypothetical protein